MALLADLIGFAEPREDFAVHFFARMEAKRMHVIARRDVFDFGEARIFQAAGEDDVADEAVAPKANGCETHAYLKSDARLFGQGAYRPAALHELGEFTEQCDGLRSFSGEMLAQGEVRTGMRLIAVGEEPAAFGAFPKWRPSHGRLPRRNLCSFDGDLQADSFGDRD